MSAEASFPVAPKWILMNFPCGQMEQGKGTGQRDRVKSCTSTQLRYLGGSGM